MNREKIIETLKELEKKTKELKKMIAPAYYELNKEKRKEYSDSYYKRNKDRLKKRRMERYYANHEEAKKYLRGCYKKRKNK